MRYELKNTKKVRLLEKFRCLPFKSEAIDHISTLIKNGQLNNFHYQDLKKLNLQALKNLQEIHQIMLIDEIVTNRRLLSKLNKRSLSNLILDEKDDSACSHLWYEEVIEKISGLHRLFERRTNATRFLNKDSLLKLKAALNIHSIKILECLFDIVTARRNKYK